mmetsp:Transcript_13993/g.28550  ORF Transcript_13993/g.28550 Transcript_13993/m.28550 type:complete len:533 (+) Transcript_13993:96-1694(+)
MTSADHHLLTTNFYSTFPGEEFLTVSLPNYARERQLIIYKIVATVILCVVVMPVLLATKQTAVKDNPADAADGAANENAIYDDAKAINKGSKNKKKRVKSKKSSQESTTETTTEETTATVINPITSNLLNILCIILVFIITFFNQNNLFPARTIVQTPVLTREECSYIIQMAHEAAERNSEIAKREKASLILEQTELVNEEDISSKSQSDGNNTQTFTPEQIELRKLNSIIKEPTGWKKDRHSSYPTTDLNYVVDPFTRDDRAYLAGKLNARLTPVIERTFGIARGALRASDIFVVRYDATKGQPQLRKHTDGSHLSFNILLNDEFEGGGTRFHNRFDGSYVDVNPDVGEALISHADILHEGLATTKGTRYILVGFNSIDENDPLTGEATNLSIFSSWLNFPWMQVRFKEGFEEGTNTRLSSTNVDNWEDSRYATSLFRDLVEWMRWFCDQYSTFQRVKLVDRQDFDEYITVMDEANIKRNEEEARNGIEPTRSSGHANWFSGQQLFVGVSGDVKRVWGSRAKIEDKFRGDL